MKSNWREEVEKFRKWVTTREELAGWELNYPRWDVIHAKADKFWDNTKVSEWTADESNDMLFLLAKDWDQSHFAHKLRHGEPEVIFHLASEALQTRKASDWDARWQLAEELKYLPLDARTEPLLLRFVDDEEEYVRRRALQSLTRIGSSQAEQLALREWNREDENQQWARMNALSCWTHINSPLLEPHLCEAESSEMEYLSYFARRLRNGEAEPL